MKKTHGNKKMHFNARLFCVCLLFLTPFLCTCGLDKYEYIEAPDTLYHRPYETSTFEDKYFEFNTKAISSNWVKEGTAVYYRIYNSLSKMNTDVGTITNYIYSEDNKAKAAEKLLETNEKNQGFKPLLYTDYSESILVGDGDSHRIKIRLSDYLYYEDDENSFDDYKACIIFDNDKVNSYRPVRYTENLTFNFGRYATETKSHIPTADDLDVCYSESTSEDDENRWYIPMFALGVGLDNSFKYYYSVPLYLGFVIINDNEVDN